MNTNTLQTLEEMIKKMIKGRKGKGNIAERLEMTENLLKEYDELLNDSQTYSRSSVLQGLANFLLMDELQDNNPHKSEKEYSVLTSRQEYRRKEREIPVGENMDFVVWGFSEKAKLTQPKKNLPVDTHKEKIVQTMNKKKVSQFQQVSDEKGKNFLKVEAVRCRKLYATYEPISGEVIVFNNKKASFIDESEDNTAQLFFPIKMKKRVERFRVQPTVNNEHLQDETELYEYLMKNYFNII